MKISKIAAGLGVAALAMVAAITSAKTYSPAPYFVKTGDISNPCTRITPGFQCTVGGTSCITSGGSQLYLSTGCSTPLRRL